MNKAVYTDYLFNKVYLNLITKRKIKCINTKEEGGKIKNEMKTV